MKIQYYIIVALIFCAVPLFFIRPDFGFEKYSETSQTQKLQENQSFGLVPSVQWPVPGSAPEENVNHTIPLEEIKQGCNRQDCIPSIDNPIFAPVDAMTDIIAPHSIGIALSYKGVNRFYPFPMLETHELVNDTVAGDPLLISYCPLCGTGIVFDRVLEGEPVLFGVSGMLWQSNLLMYNRAQELQDRNLWSQVLGQSVVGRRAGEKLTIIPSDIMRFSDWTTQYPQGQILTTGLPRDPYGGKYYSVAQRFEPNFDVSQSPLLADTYVYGVEIDGVYKAYPRDDLPEGEIRDMIGSQVILITNDNQKVTVKLEDGSPVSDVEGFWFSWYAAHPDTLLWNN